MRNITLKMFLIGGLLSSCDISCVKNVIYPKHVRDENYERIADRVTSRVAQKLKTEKGLQSAGVGGRMMDDIQRMAMSFQLFHEVDLDEARKILVYSIAEYLNAINSSKDLRPYLHSYPFKPENVEIMIWVHTRSGHDVPINQITFVSFFDDVLRYDLLDKSSPYTTKELLKETYEEALKIVKEQEEAHQPQAS